MKETPLTLGHALRHSDHQLRRSEWQTNWATALFFRTPGVAMAWLLLRMGVTPMKVTLSGLALAILMPICASVLPLGIAGPVLFLLAVMFEILDCADGTMARISNTVSETGARADFLADMLHWGLLYLAFGILADRMFDQFWLWTALAGIAAWLRLFARICNDSVPKIEVETSATLPPLWLRFIMGLSGLIPLLTIFPNHMHLVVSAVLIYALLDIGDAVGRAFR
jgi:phosphatidylglycerophosphate synthase